MTRITQPDDNDTYMLHLSATKIKFLILAIISSMVMFADFLLALRFGSTDLGVIILVASTILFAIGFFGAILIPDSQITKRDN